MSNIIEAMHAEELYLSKTLNGEDAELYPVLSALGYNDLEEYFAEKVVAQLHGLSYDIYTGDITWIPTAIKSAVFKQVPTIFWPECHNDFVWHGSDSIDKEYCAENNIDILDVRYDGGNIVSSPADFSFGILVPEYIDVNSGYFLRGLAEIVPGAIVSGNDLLVSGEKVIGTMSFRENDMFFFGCQASFTDHTELIHTLCNKVSEKIPGYIKDMPVDVYKKEVLSWLLGQ